MLLGLGGLALTSSACSTHDCDPSSATFSGDGGILTRLDTGELLWQSSPLTGPYLSYPGMQTLDVEFPSGFTDPHTLVVSVSTGAYQDGAVGAPAAGQLAETPSITSTGFQLQNNSCSDYFVYFEVRGFPLQQPDGGRTR